MCNFYFFEQKERTPIHKTQQIIIIIWRENIARNLLDNSEKFKLPFWRCFLPNTSCPAQLLSICSLWIVVVTLEQTLNFHQMSNDGCTNESTDRFSIVMRKQTQLIVHPAASIVTMVRVVSRVPGSRQEN